MSSTEFLNVWHPPISSPWHQQEFKDQFVVLRIALLIDIVNQLIYW